MPDERGDSGMLFRYDGPSMWPTFQEGDILEVEKAPAGALRRGDCIVYRRPGDEAAAVHRIVRLKGGIRTRGDNRPAEDDEPVSDAWILGRVQARVRYGQEAVVRGGAAGIWAGRFYRRAGRIDPNRTGRGGAAARLVQSTLGRAFPLCARRAGPVSLRVDGDGTGRYLAVGKRRVGTYNDKGQAWSIAWPWNLLLEPRLLPPPQ